MSLSPDKGKGLTPEDYLDLERRFLKASDNENAENAAQDSYLIASLLAKEEGFGWPELLQHQIVIILGEPGSGKTTELRSKSKELRKKGKRAFFFKARSDSHRAFRCRVRGRIQKSL
jgi:Cdc6-like AAA superfamily ATPase